RSIGPPPAEAPDTPTHGAPAGGGPLHATDARSPPPRWSACITGDEGRAGAGTDARKPPPRWLTCTGAAFGRRRRRPAGTLLAPSLPLVHVNHPLGGQRASLAMRNGLAPALMHEDHPL